jgi:methionyl-tRNA formyltransferase
MTSPDVSGLRVIFLGTPEFAVPSLEALERTTTVVAVVTQPDRPAGRGRKIVAPPVAAAARLLGLPVLQPGTLRDGSTQAALAALRPDLITVVAYGLLIPPAVLALPSLGAINVHPSLLPTYRGASPIQAAIRDGASVTGVTVLHVVDEMDAGDIILQREVPIGPEESAGELEGRLAGVGAGLLAEAVRLLASGAAPRRAQDRARATYVAKVSKADGEIQWNRPAQEIVNHIRAMNPWPCAFTTWPGGVLRVWRARVVEGTGPAGIVLSAGDTGVTVAAGGGAVCLLEVQSEGGRRMTAAEFLRGHPLREGQRLGDR